MTKLYRLFLIPVAALSLVACEKDEPIEMLGKYTDEYRPEVRMSLSNRNPELGDTVTFTVSTWQRNDKIAKIELLHKLYEDFGVYFELETTKLQTWSETDPLMVVTDTIAKNTAWRSVPEGGKTLNDYFVTSTNDYVVQADYTHFKPEGGTYSAEGEELLNQLPAEAYSILLNQLSYAISVAEYNNLFPEAPDSHFTMSGTTRTGISAEGRAYLQDNLSKALLIEKGFKTIRKEGALGSIVTARVTTDSGVSAQTSSEFKTTY
ncbi:hypothetical protein [uncultured Pontibacter sp.]|uniref:hypothetical protein n=1 Tax=uncultured Pontibacter sp. TaxID=453356 RepID=UPI0026381CF6|nr:hypothetical protein [uncultured Pontibacter sp.]